MVAGNAGVGGRDAAWQRMQQKDVDHVEYEPITSETVRERAKLAGVTIDEERIEDIAFSMDQSLSVLSKLDWRELRIVEPAIIFNPAWSE
jgi:hypothetical protein